MSIEQKFINFLFIFFSLFYFHSNQITTMLQNLQKITQQCLNQASPDSTKTALLQSYYYNLTNLRHKINSQKAYFGQKIQNNMKYKQCKYNLVDIENKLPQLSISHFSNKKISNSNDDMHISDCSLLAKISQRSLVNRSINYTNSLSFNNINKTGVSLRLNDSSKQNELAISTSIKFDPNNKHKNNFRSKLKTKPKRGQLHSSSLRKGQRYFENRNVVVRQDIVEKIGLYQSGHLFKSNNINKFIDQNYANKMKPVINLRFASIGSCPKDQLFLTQNSYCPTLNDADSYSDLMGDYQSKQKCRQQSSKQQSHKQSRKVVQNIQQRYLQKPIFEQQLDEIIQKQQQRHSQKNSTIIQLSKRKYWIIEIHDYQIRKNQEYFGLKSTSIEDWNQISFILQEIIKYLKSIKISHFSFKFQVSTFLRDLWPLRKLKRQKIEELLKIRLTKKSKYANNTNIKKQVQIMQNHDEMAYSEQQKNFIKVRRTFGSRIQIIRQIVRLWKDRKNLQMKKKQHHKRTQLLIRLCLRISIKYRMSKRKQQKIERVLQLNKRFKQGYWKPDVQIYLPSFSESEFIRNTTQYMQTYENMFYHMWSSSSKHVILILPAVNQVLLKIFQDRIKTQKNITLICPDSHQIYPKNLPLAAYLLYSKDSINKIKKILQNRKGIIIPGRQLSSYRSKITASLLDYEINLSDLLMIPLYCNLQQSLNSSTVTHSNFGKQSVKNIQQKQLCDTSDKLIFSQSKIAIPISQYIPPNSKNDILIQKLSKLLIENKNTKKWLFKLNGEFNGRGIAIFDASSSKKLKEILSLEYFTQSTSFGMINQSGRNYMKKQYTVSNKLKIELKNQVMEYLGTYFRLKLTVNFQNCIYRVQEYIQKFLKYGGVIEEYIQNCETYEFCYRIEPGQYKAIKKHSENVLNISNKMLNSNNKVWMYHTNKYLATCKSYEIDFVTKLSIFESLSPSNQFGDNEQILQFQEKVSKMLTDHQYLGYVSVVGLYSSFNQTMYGIEIKKYVTLNSSMSQYLGAMKKLENRPLRQMSISENFPLYEKDECLDQSQSMEVYRQKNRRNFKLNEQNTQIINQSSTSNYNGQSCVLDTAENIVSMFIPTIIFTDVDEVTRSELVQNLLLQQQQLLQQQLQQHKSQQKLGSCKQNGVKFVTDTRYGIKYLSLGLTLGLLLYGDKKEVRRMKKIAIEHLRKISERVDLCKMYRGKQQIRDVFRFGDVIRAISKIL